MARGKTTPRMTTGPGHTPRPNEPAIALNRDGSIQRDPQKDRLKERIRHMKREFLRAKKMMQEAQEIMVEVEQMFLELEPNFDNIPDLGKDN